IDTTATGPPASARAATTSRSTPPVAARSSNCGPRGARADQVGDPGRVVGAAPGRPLRTQRHVPRGVAHLDAGEDGRCGAAGRVFLSSMMVLPRFSRAPGRPGVAALGSHARATVRGLRGAQGDDLGSLTVWLTGRPGRETAYRTAPIEQRPSPSYKKASGSVVS